jgi:hypothetical protein
VADALRDEQPPTDASAGSPAAGATADTVTALDVDGVRAVGVGTILWTIAFLVCLLLREQLAAAGSSWWTWVCLTGALLGLPGLWYVRRRARAYARRSASAA